MPHTAQQRPEPAPERGRVRLAVFDFDGTSIAGNSPVLLVQHLMRRKMLKKRVIFRILLWAAAYKLRLPQNESWVRGLVFTAFEGHP
ncbi:MAG: HAD-IB family hydrolase, partial [Eggerthellaceae bacterium]